MGSVKLLNQTLGLYLRYSIIILLIAAPVFYFSISELYREDTDETLLLYKKEFLHYYAPHFKATEIEKWNQYNRDIKIETLPNTLTTDTFFYQTYLDTLDHENEPYRVLQTPIHIENKPYMFFARVSLVESEDLIGSIAIMFIVLIVMLLSVLIVLTHRFSRRIWLPFQQTLEKLKSFDLTAQQPMTFPNTEIQEFEELNQSLKRLTDKNISIYVQQKTFIENASHELQTPLAILKAKLDLLLQNKDLTLAQAEIINMIELPLARMARINKNLLLLAKIENNQFEKNEPIFLSQLIYETLELLSGYIEEKEIRISQEIKEELSLFCNKTLIEILVNNLLINAIVHNNRAGKIDICLSNQVLKISNTGKIALNHEKIFKRFSITSTETVSSGLGLAIIQEISNRYAWKLGYTFEKNMHVFTLNFS